MRKSVIPILFFMVALIATAATANAQTRTTLGLSSARITIASNGTGGAPPNAPTVNFVADPDNATSIGDATQTGNDEFRFSHGPVITAPEPSTMLLFGSGLILIAGVLRRWMRRSKATSRIHSGVSSDQFPPLAQRDMNTDGDGVHVSPRGS